MTDLTAQIATNTRVTSYVYDGTRGLFYYASDATVFSYNPLTCQTASLVTLSGPVGSIALTSDGASLIVGLADYSVGSAVPSRIETVLKIPMASAADASTYTTWHYDGGTYETGVSDLAVTPDNQVLMTTDLAGSGLTPLRVFATSTPDGSFLMDTVPGLLGVMDRSVLLESENVRYIVIQEVNSSSAPIELYDTQSHTVIAHTNFSPAPYYGADNKGRGDISEAAGLVMDIVFFAVAIFDLNLNLVADLRDLHGGNGNLLDGKFIDGGKKVLLWQKSTNSVLVVDTTTWKQVGTVDLSGIESVGQSDDGRMLVSDDGRFLLLESDPGFGLTGGALASVDLGARMHINQTGTDANDVLTDGLGAALLSGLSGDDVLNGAAGNDQLNGGAGNDALNGGEGSDWALFGDATASVTVDLRAATAQDTGQGMDTLSSIENVAGGAYGDTLTGTADSNVLDGGAGADTLTGGAGNDTYIVDNTADLVIENASEGADTVRSSITYTLGAELENLELSGSGNIDGIGNAVVNVITGTSGANRLDGGGGADVLSGGAGNDTYVVDAADVLGEGANQGKDTVIASLDFVLAGNFENLILQGAAVNGTGNTADNELTGNALDNHLYGGAGRDYLDGGTGADIMEGGTGFDIYMVDNAGDIVTEVEDWSVDLVYATVSFRLGNFVEWLNLRGTGNIAAYGNAQLNTINGNDGNNFIDGGAEGDTMSGGKGNDTYVIDSSSDYVYEDTGEGIDLILSSISLDYVFRVENVTLTGNADLNILANELNNVLTGNGGANLIDGGLGADTMRGGAGNDTFVVDDAADKVLESNNQGIDTVETAMSYALTGLYVENLTVSGTGNFAVGGNGFANVLIGNSGSNTINGGLNGDTMSGAAGNDLYFVDHVGDVVVELANEGKDAVNASITYTLTDNVETLALIGYQAINGTGNGLDNTVTGNGNANQLNGGDGKDLLIGQGGNDILTGGAGADSFRFYRAGALNGLDHLTDFVSGTDKLQLTGADYGFAKGQVLTAAQVHTGGSVGAFGQFLYNIVNHTLYWDADGTGATAAVALAVFDNSAQPVAGDFVFL